MSLTERISELEARVEHLEDCFPSKHFEECFAGKPLKLDDQKSREAVKELFEVIYKYRFDPSILKEPLRMEYEQYENFNDFQLWREW